MHEARFCRETKRTTTRVQQRILDANPKVLAELQDLRSTTHKELQNHCMWHISPQHGLLVYHTVFNCDDCAPHRGARDWSMQPTWPVQAEWRRIVGHPRPTMICI